MTSSQEPPLTRREMRERERLLEQQSGQPTPDSDGQPAAAPQAAPYTPPAPANPPAAPVAPSQPAVREPSTAPTFAPPRPGGGFPVPQGSPFGGPAVTPPPMLS